ncbi:hypothetical protein EVAR_21383_1 [Eumeta japonica]|uniref:Uncharacterized protein n=1 Tax=Eumeta variegata TaxID=151549 RepID=A0A4C1VFE4_EUMVA|nr:hypothetical protein EVAR_21383_1 [Eumeta japonica]
MEAPLSRRAVIKQYRTESAESCRSRRAEVVAAFEVSHESTAQMQCRRRDPSKFKKYIANGQILIQGIITVVDERLELERKWMTPLSTGSSPMTFKQKSNRRVRLIGLKFNPTF